MTGAERRVCPDCGSDNVQSTLRGFAGATDERNQFFQCQECDRRTFEILSRTERDMKLDRVEAGDVVEAEKKTYRVTRVLKIGIDEYLVYVKADNEARRELRMRRLR